MKLRIKGNSIRLRLTQPEVKKFATEGMVEEVIKFGNSSHTMLHYTLQKSSGKTIDAYFNLNRILVNIPEEIAAKWTSTAQVSLEGKMKLNEKEELTILVEKDFQCLQTRIGEDESEMFPHPDEGNLKC